MQGPANAFVMLFYNTLQNQQKLLPLCQAVNMNIVFTVYGIFLPFLSQCEFILLFVFVSPSF